MVCIKLICVGTKNVAKELAKLTKGRVKDRDKTWFTELADKRMFEGSTTCTIYVQFILSQEGALKSTSTGP